MIITFFIQISQGIVVKGPGENNSASSNALTPYKRLITNTQMSQYMYIHNTLLDHTQIDIILLSPNECCILRITFVPDQLRAPFYSTRNT